MRCRLASTSDEPAEQKGRANGSSAGALRDSDLRPPISGSTQNTRAHEQRLTQMPETRPRAQPAMQTRCWRMRQMGREPRVASLLQQHVLALFWSRSQAACCTRSFPRHGATSTGCCVCARAPTCSGSPILYPSLSTLTTYAELKNGNTFI